MSPSKYSLLLLALVATLSSVQAHLQLASPYPYRSSLNPDTPEAMKDYSMTSPLVSNGLPYPCKGYIGTPDEGPREQWTAGQTVAVTMAGTAVHGGGSCQYSLSYDNGTNFHVIRSIIGGCNLDTLQFEVEIPAEAPAADGVIFAWTWFNKVGNREMYMNCLSADIISSASTTPLSGPTIYVANAAVNQCSTIEGTPVVFPSPGSVITYGGEYAGLSIGNGLVSGAGVVGSDCYAPGSVGAGTDVVVTTTTAAAVVTSTSTKAATSSTKAATTSSKTAASPIKAATSSIVKVATSSAATSTPVLVVLHSSSTSASVKVATTSSKAAITSSKAAITSSKATTLSKAATTSSKATTTSSKKSTSLTAATSASKIVTSVVKATTSTTTTKVAVAAAPTVVVPTKCTTGEWKCVGQVLTECANDIWYSMADCTLQTGTVCSASTPIGCVWPFQVAAGRKRHLSGHASGGHGSAKKRMLPPPVVASP